MARLTDQEGKGETSRPKVRVCRNGPYVLTGKIPVCDETILCGDDGIPVRWEKGRDYPANEACSLCRCGRSGSRPYCDGSHERAGFDGTETAGKEEYLDRPDKTEGPGLILWDTEKLCAVALFCHRAGDAWNLTEQSGDPVKKATAMEEVRDCPSGRLVAVDKASGKTVEPEIGPSIALVFGPQEGVPGPIWVRGCIPVESADGRTYTKRNRVTLCRCGKSCNKPFCDGSHKQSAPKLEVP